MDIFIIGITGGIGHLLAQRLRSRGDTVRGLVRREDQQADLAQQAIDTQVGDLAGMSAEDLAAAFGDVDVIVFSAGSNGGSTEVTRAIDGDGVATAITAAVLAGIDRFALVSRTPRIMAGKGSRTRCRVLLHREEAGRHRGGLLHETRISRQIRELNTGSTPIAAAVQANVR